MILVGAGDFETVIEVTSSTGAPSVDSFDSEHIDSEGLVTHPHEPSEAKHIHHGRIYNLGLLSDACIVISPVADVFVHQYGDRNNRNDHEQSNKPILDSSFLLKPVHGSCPNYLPVFL